MGVTVVPNSNEDCYNYIWFSVTVSNQATLLTNANTSVVFGSLLPYTNYVVSCTQYINTNGWSYTNATVATLNVQTYEGKFVKLSRLFVSLSIC